MCLSIVVRSGFRTPRAGGSCPELCREPAAARRRVAEYGDGWCPFPAQGMLAKTARTDVLDSNAQLAQGIDRMRRGQVDAEPGYDGEYGVIRVFSGAAAEAETPQIALFAAEPATLAERPPAYTPLSSQPDAATVPVQQESLFAAPEAVAATPAPAGDLLAGLNDDQRAAVFCTDAPLVIVAGPVADWYSSPFDAAISLAGSTPPALAISAAENLMPE